MNKRILHLVDSSGYYGAENVILTLSREMLSTNYVPVIGCITQNSLEEVQLLNIARLHNIETLRLVINIRSLLRDIYMATFDIQNSNISIIHSHGYKPSVFGFIIAFLSGIKIISTCHLWFLGTHYPLKQRIMIKLELFFYRFFPYIVAVSDDIKNTLIRSKIPAHKISLIRNGIYLSDFRPTEFSRKQELRKKLSIPEKFFVLLHVARLTEQKAQIIILSSVKLMIEKKYPIFLLIAGDGELRGELEAYIETHQLCNHVKLLGFRNDICELLQMSDAFVLTSFDEGMPISLLEAIATKLPVIVTAVGDIPKLIKDGISGTVVDVNDIFSLSKAIEFVYFHPNEAKIRARNAYNIVIQGYSSYSMLESYKKIYDALI